MVWMIWCQVAVDALGPDCDCESLSSHFLCHKKLTNFGTVLLPSFSLVKKQYIVLYETDFYLWVFVWVLLNQLFVCLYSSVKYYGVMFSQSRVVFIKSKLVCIFMVRKRSQVLFKAKVKTSNGTMLQDAIIQLYTSLVFMH